MYELIDSASMTPEFEIFVDEFDFFEFDDDISFLDNNENIVPSHFSYEASFNNLKDKYFNDRFEFYCLCKKSQIIYNNGFYLQLENRFVNIVFQTERYDLTMELFIKSISCLKKCLIVLNKQLKKINNSFLKDIESEKNKINFVITENYALLDKDENYVLDKRDYNDSTCPLACYTHCFRRVTIFTNIDNKPKFKGMLDDINHELGHFFNFLITFQNPTSENVYLNSLKKDTKLAFKNQKLINSGSARKRGWYNHMSPKRDFSLWRQTMGLLNDSNSWELFAESFAEAIKTKYAKKKNKVYPKSAKKFNDLYPNTKYFIDKMLEGKRPNRFKSIKLKKQPTR